MAGNRRRDKNRQAYWERMIERQRHSGVSIRAFCRGHKLTETSFYFWRAELARRRDEAGTTHFVPVRLTAQEPSAGHASPKETSLRPSSPDQDRRSGMIEIELPGGSRIRLTPPVDAQSLGHVLAALSFDHGHLLSVCHDQAQALNHGLAQAEARRC